MSEDVTWRHLRDAEYSKAWRTANIEKKRLYDADYRGSHRENVRAYNTAYVRARRAKPSREKRR